MADTNESDTGMPQVGSQDHFRLATFVLLLFGADTPHTRMGLESSLCGRPKPLPDLFFFQVPTAWVRSPIIGYFLCDTNCAYMLYEYAKLCLANGVKIYLFFLRLSTLFLKKV